MRRRPWLPVLIFLAILAAACGVPEDSTPRAISESALQPPTPEAEATPTPEVAEETRLVAIVYLLDENGLLAPVTRDLSDPSDPAEVLAGLLIGPTDEEVEDLNLSSAIPPTEVVLSSQLVDRTLTVNLGPDGLFQLEGDEQKRAIAQLVYTATEIDSVDNVLVQIENEFRPLPTDEADTTELQPVDRLDYRSLDPRFAPEEPVDGVAEPAPG